MRLGRRAAVGLFVVGAAAAVLVVDGGAAAAVRGVVASPWFPAVLVALYLVRPFLAWPITALSALVGYAYGVTVGVPVALAGAVATSLLPYAAGRWLRDPDPGASVGGTGTPGVVDRAVAWLAASGERFFAAAGDVRGVVAARLAPTPAEPVSAGAGVARVSLPAFVAGTLVGELPWTLAAVSVGASLDSLDGGLRVPADPLLVAGCLLAAALLLAGPTYRALAAAR